MHSTKTRIISVSRRTDIPAHYWSWFRNRVMQGHCVTVNPFNPSYRKMISLKPADVDVFVFWTRNPRRLMKDTEFFRYLKDNYHFYFLFTLNGYPKILEPGLPSVENSIGAFRELSSALPPGSVVWRYDPIIISDETGFDYHKKRFSYIAGLLSGYTGKVIVSIFDPYRKADIKLKSAGINYRIMEDLQDDSEFTDLMNHMKETADSYGIEITSCCEDLARVGIKSGGCIDDGLMNDLFGPGIKGRKDRSQRKNCRCIESTDIGAYNTCIYGCKYCYAVRDFEKAKIRFNNHDETAESL
ncbi:MAG: DUF1848 domain-containing protein [Candidatus Eremiobacteraeota bacterium]|nr:DUF1848 domain-containing protein [Candidatus Eremiobacteraeota bacterium]